MTGLYNECKYLANVKEVSVYCIYSKDSSDSIIKAFSIKYCKTLNKVIKEIKNNITVDMAKSENKMKTTWNIIKLETGKIHLSIRCPLFL
jgi:hypothetical protein